MCAYIHQQPVSLCFSPLFLSPSPKRLGFSNLPISHLTKQLLHHLLRFRHEDFHQDTQRNPLRDRSGAERHCKSLMLSLSTCCSQSQRSHILVRERLGFMFLFFSCLYFCYFFELQSLITCLDVFALFVTYVFFFFGWDFVVMFCFLIAFGVFIYLLDYLIRYLFLVLRIGMFHFYPLLPFLIY